MDRNEIIELALLIVISLAGLTCMIAMAHALARVLAWLLVAVQ